MDSQTIGFSLIMKKWEALDYLKWVKGIYNLSYNFKKKKRIHILLPILK